MEIFTNYIAHTSYANDPNIFILDETNCILNSNAYLFYDKREVVLNSRI